MDSKAGMIKPGLTFEETRRYDYLTLLSIIFPDRMTEGDTKEFEELKGKMK